MGVDRALIVVELQTLLMSGIRNYREHAGVAGQTHRMLATAASLDYVLMLVTDSAGTRIPSADAQRAIREGLARAVDDALVLLRAMIGVDAAGARAFSRDGLRTVRSAIDAEALGNDERMFATIALAADLCA